MIATAAQPKSKLQTELKSFFEIALKSPRLESFFLHAMAELELQAGDQILGNITKLTPPHLVEEIRGHANDEYRHATQLTGLANAIEPESSRTEAEERLLKKMVLVARSFVVGYFGNPLLTKLRDRHAAYVHGAITIEQFPFQVYTVYQDLTTSTFAKEVMPAVIQDEHQHIALGRRMLRELPVEMRVDVSKLQEIEREMSCLLFQRLRRILLEFRSTTSAKAPSHVSPTTKVSYSEDDVFFQKLNQDPKKFYAWIQTLGMAEARAAEATTQFFNGAASDSTRPDFLEGHLADEVRHQGMLHRSILLKRSQYRRLEEFQLIESQMHVLMQRYQNRIFGFLKRKRLAPELVYFYATSIIEARVFRHYSSLIQNSDDILVSFAVAGILEDERQHAQIFHEALSSHPRYDAEIFKELKNLENVYFYRMLHNAFTPIDDEVTGSIPATDAHHA